MNGALPDIDALRIPLRYLANLLTAGDEEPVRLALLRMLAMRAYMRARHVDGEEAPDLLEQVDLTRAQAEGMYRDMAIANDEDRFVNPSTHREYAENAFDLRSSRGFSFGNGCSGSLSSSVSSNQGKNHVEPTHRNRDEPGYGACLSSARRQHAGIHGVLHCLDDVGRTWHMPA